ncbi:hypothetical protein BKA93DRAFT_750155 [Sparassis latifolia]
MSIIIYQTAGVSSYFPLGQKQCSGHMSHDPHQPVGAHERLQAVDHHARPYAYQQTESQSITAMRSIGAPDRQSELRSPVDTASDTGKECLLRRRLGPAPKVRCDAGQQCLEDLHWFIPATKPQTALSRTNRNWYRRNYRRQGLAEPKYPRDKQKPSDTATKRPTPENDRARRAMRRPPWVHYRRARG